MQLRIDALDTHLSRPLARLYVIASGEHLLALEASDKIRGAARAQGFGEREVLQVDRSFNWGELLAANQSQSLFGERKLIELRIPTGKPGKDGSHALQTYATELSGDSVTLITLPKLDWATQKAAWVGSLQQAAVYIDIPLVERTQLPAWISTRLAMQQQSADWLSVNFIADRVEGNLLAAHQEILKLALLYPPGQLDGHQIRDAVLNVARFDVFKVNDAMVAGDMARLVRMIEGLQGEGEALPLVLWAIADEIRTLLRVRLAVDAGRSTAQACAELRLRGNKVALIEAAMPRLPLPLLENALRDAAQVDRMIKGLQSKNFAGDAWDGIMQLGLIIAQGQK